MVMQVSHTRGFGSDNHAAVHPKILQAITDNNFGHAPSYGTDALSSATRELFSETFGKCETYFVFNGTAANVLCLRAYLKSHEAVITTEVSHLAVDECGAPEFHGGHKIITVPSVDGKLKVADIARHLVRRGDQHAVQVRMVSITQPTELGTVYSLAELKELRDFTRQHGLLLHVDGARFANAVVHTGSSFKAMTSEVGIDALSFGGTKNGLLGGEAILFFNTAELGEFRYIQKQEMQLPSKTRFIAAQFSAYLQNHLWHDIAKRSLDLATELAASLQDVNEIEITQTVQSNAVFARLPKAWIKPLKETCFFYVWDEREWIVRLMLSFDNSSEDILRFRSSIGGLRG